MIKASITITSEAERTYHGSKLPNTECNKTHIVNVIIFYFINLEAIQE